MGSDVPTKYTVTLSSMGTSSVIAIPKPIIDGFGLEKGEKLEVYVSDDGIYIPLKAKHTSTNLKELKNLK